MSKEFDVVVIGGGPGGYIAAIRAAQLGKTVACIDKWKNRSGEPKLGGTCLNVGCIPSKALLASSEEFEKINYHLASHGITVSDVKINIEKMLDRKDRIIQKMTCGIEFLFRKNNIIWLKGHGKFIGKNPAGIQIEIKSEEEIKNIIAKNVIIATGSKARHIKTAPVDGKIIVDNEGALSFETVPKRLIVIGAGVIGLELGSVWRRLGSNVTVLEAMPEFLATVDESIAREASKLFKRQGLSINTGVQIIESKILCNDSISVTYTDKDNSVKTINADRLIVSIGRIPNTDNLGLELIGLKKNDCGFIDVDDYCRTSISNIYAIGDVVRGPMLAHKAEDEGILVAEIIDGQKPRIDYDCIPWVIYTQPEIAWVGKTEQQLRKEGCEIKIGKFPFTVNGRALSMNNTDGLVKIIADSRTDQVLGVHIISSNASELISESVLAMEFRAASEDIARICHPHPSLSEAVREAALDVDNRSLNI
ncbi:MAG: dihydrolipoyl dehydrogenase [Burkholderia sp.]|nr:dihydrolipoyl dehydrogenase [Burkholderia sp.]